jgi:hypothetical protein
VKETIDMTPSRRQWIRAGLGGLAAGALGGCRGTLAMNTSSRLSQAQIDALFDKPKLMCFGRYAVELPGEAEQVFGHQTIDSGFKQFSRSDYSDASMLLLSEWQKALLRNRTAERITRDEDGPARGAKYFWLYWNKEAKRDDSRLLYGAIPVGRIWYLYKGMSDSYEGISNEEIFRRMTALMRGMRAWNGIEVPREPGVCIDGAFIHEPTQRFQEIMSSGFYFPSLPDVSFSVMSNKNASVDGDNGHGLLRRVDEARREQMFYPYTFLRRGKRTLHGLWDGEEVLARRSDGALIFDWELVGEPGNPARPSWFEMGFRTRVANNQVGAAETTSISDEQAIALWDRLLDNVKFRVMVPGATPQAVARL